MRSRALAPWSWLLLAALPAGAAVREVPVVDMSAAGAPAASVGAAATVISAPLAAPLAAPMALPLAPLAASDRPEAMRYDPALPAEPARALVAGEPQDGLAALRRALERRGDGGSLAEAEHLYYTDPLTGLPNRSFLIERGASLLARTADPAVAMLDMNNFGAVNLGLADLHGVTKGRARADAALALAGGALSELAHAHGVVVVRLGGEEFAVLGPREGVLSFTAAARRAITPERLLDAVGIVKDGAERKAIEAAMARIGRGDQPVGDFTYGVASALGRTPDAAIKAADEALNSAKADGRRGGIRVVGADGVAADWTPPAAEGPQPALPPEAPRRDTLAAVSRLEARLQPNERVMFHEAAFRDPLTMSRTYDSVGLRSGEWDRRYAGGGSAALLSARNLKQINDVLGHDAGDRYLRSLGILLRRTVNRARKTEHLDVQEPVRVASKEFLFVGRDAQAVALLAQKAVAAEMDAGRLLAPDEVARLRAEVAAHGLAPADRIGLIGTLRVVTERLDDGRGHADSKDALDRAFERLEEVKRAEDAGAP